MVSMGLPAYSLSMGLYEWIAVIAVMAVFLWWKRRPLG